MIELSGIAYAKLNLTLDVVGRRNDGYHNLCMVMQEISLGDKITVNLNTGGPWTLTTDSGEIPCDDHNLVVKAAKSFFRAADIEPDGMHVQIDKQTPVCAGMGGGSADGALMLKLLQAHYGNPLSEKQLYSIAEETGSDVPFALFGGTALAEEKGQVLSRLPSLPDCSIVLCKPPFPISTPELFSAIDREKIQVRPDTEGMLAALNDGSLRDICSRLYNVFEPVVSRGHPEIQQLKNRMIDFGALGACMSGSGPTVFGIFDDSFAAEACRDELKKLFNDTFLVCPVSV